MSKEADGGSQAQCSPLRSTCSQPPCLASRCTRLNRGNSCGPRGGSLSPTRNVCRRDPKVSFVTGRLPVDEPDQERTDRHQQANANGVNFSTPITTKLIDCSPFVIMGNTMQGHAALVGVDNIELQLGQNLLHGFQIQPCPGDVRCLFILLLQRQKTAGLAEGIGD